MIPKWYPKAVISRRHTIKCQNEKKTKIKTMIEKKQHTELKVGEQELH